VAGEPAARCYRVLVVDEDPRSRRVVVAALAREGMEAVEAATEDAARIALASTPPDVVVLDVSVGGLDGFTLLSEIRHDSDVPVVVLTDRAEEPFKLLGLELGADDYMAKPFSPLELTSRIRVILRRAHSHDGAGSIRAGELIM
jgi:DNA-binding response OmpR family regulator